LKATGYTQTLGEGGRRAAPTNQRQEHHHEVTTGGQARAGRRCFRRAGTQVNASPSPATSPTPHSASGSGRPPSFETIRTVRTFETAIEHIVEGLERARLRRGDRLPNEAQLADQLGISKPTLRQALLVLERAGLLDVRLGKTGGVFVASDLVPTDAISTAVALEERAIVDVLRARRVIETAVVHYAIKVADAGDYAELEHSIDLVRAHLGDRTAVMAADAMFHRVLVRACRNETMRAAMRVLERRIAPVRDSYSGGRYWDAHVVDVHSRQVAAMRARDLAALEPVLEVHFRMLEDAYCSALGKEWGGLFGSGIPPAA
jgi:GntR family transcriptional repressor for pyruvate dehydrogenase complex